MIKIENWSTEDIAKYGRRIGEAFAASPGIAETIPHDDLVKLSRSLLNSTTEWVHYMQPPKNMKASLHTGIRIPDSHSGLPYI